MGKLSTIQKRENLNVVVTQGGIGPGGAHHKYAILKKIFLEKDNSDLLNVIDFQKGPRNEEDSQSGIIDSDLLEIVRDRLKSFQEGDYKSDYNEKALNHLEIALMYMNRRVEDRIERNVLGTYKK